MIQIGQAQFRLYDEGCFTTYPDGTSYAAQPHPDDADYRLIAGWLGYGDDTMRYAVEHDLCHNAVAEWGFDRRSVVLWPLAHGLEVDLQAAVGEECLVQAFQAWLRLDVRPIVGDVDWCGLRERVREVVNAL